ncbi:MAG: MMPL family transporter [Alphaproteobacteria bacterium]|nr:MMPL family transporter [Alphaproteobacteria bacterium]
MAFIGSAVAFCCRHARAVVALFVLAAVAAGTFTATHFALNTNSETLLSPQLTFRKHEARFDKLFPQQGDLILVVVDGVTQEQAIRGQALLADKLAARKDLFPIVRQPGGGTFFRKNGLLFLSTVEVKKTTEQLIQAQPFLASLAADPSLRGVMASLSTMLMGVQNGQARLEQIDAPMAAFDDTLRQVADGKPAYLAWQALVGGKGAARHNRMFIEVQPALNYDALSPGAAASDTIRADAKALGLDAAHGVRVRLTGPVPLSDEEFATLAERADLMGIVMLIAVTVTLWLAVQSFRIIFCILVTLFTGLALTMGLGLAAVGVFNIISIAFVALFVGLGVDFGIQFSVRYRAERHGTGDLEQALVRAGRGVGTPLALAAAATAAGFFSFLPTDYIGVAELGMIAGIGMVVAFVLSITMLPALLLLSNPPGEHVEVGFQTLAPVDDFIAMHRRGILLAGVAAGLVGLACIPFLKFDFNPLDLRSPKVESVSTLFDLMRDPQTSPNTIDVLAPSLDAADAKAQQLSKVPEVGMALTLKSFIPDDQQQKLALISDASLLLDAAIAPFEVKPAPSDAEVVASLKSTAQALRAAPGGAEAVKHAHALAATLARLASASPQTRRRASDAIVPDLKTMLESLSFALQAEPVTLKTMPPDMVREWVAADGTARVQVFPKDTSGSDAAMKAFGDAVQKVAPDATGAPISIRQSGIAIMSAFVQAGILAFAVIAVLLLFVLQSIRDTALTIAPLVLSGLLTLATCVALGLDLNFANVIALPLLLGIGVAFDIYFIAAWRAGIPDLLQSSLTRAVVFSALTTATGFGTLWLSSHPGTASMGELLMISLFWTLATTLFFLPALLGPPTSSRASQTARRSS